MSRLGLSLPQSLERRLGLEGVEPEERLGNYSIDGVTPRAALRPSRRDEIVEIVQFAAVEGLAVVPRGGGTQSGLGNIPRRYDVALDLSRFNKVLDYQPADLTATVEAGINLDTLQRELASGGKTLPVEVPLSSEATIGGVLAANSSGPMRATFGLPRDWLIGISVVGGTGVETKSGGKVVKNVTGYDLGKLYAGSLGTLGVIVEATFKLNPLPRRTAALTAGFGSMPAALQASNELARQVYAPQGIQILDSNAAGRLQSSPDMMIDGIGPDQALLLAFFSGRPGAVRRQLSEAGNMLRDRNASVRQVPDEGGAGNLLRDATDLGWSRGREAHLVLKASVPPSSVGDMLGPIGENVAGEIGPSGGEQGPGVAVDPGFGLVRIFWWLDEGDGVAEVNATGWAGAVNRLRLIARGHHGSLVIERAPVAVKQQVDVWGDNPEGTEIMYRIKQNLDPAGIFAPGRHAGGI
jgi:glycolate oxidase FAD binding subunit